MRLVVTGAAGFVGSALVEQLLVRGRLSEQHPPFASLVIVDASLPAIADPRIVAITGSIGDADLRDQIFAAPVDVLFHLAAIPGGAAAADYPLGWSVNVEATVAMFDALAAQKTPPRVVFTSSIGVFGVPLPSDKVDDDTLPVPTMSYGSQKLIGEILLADFARRGLIDGLAVRLPGIVARPPQKTGHLSAYMSNIFHALAAGERFEAPVSAGATSWFMSRQRCVENLIHAAALPVAGLGTRRAFNLPALRLSMAELVDGLAHHFGAHVRDLVSYAPNEALEAQFGAYPPLHTAIADALGFVHDGDAASLVANALDIETNLKRVQS